MKEVHPICQKIPLSKKSGTLHKEDLDQAYTVSIENISKIIKQDLVLPLVNSLERLLENLNLEDENSIYLMEEELFSILISLLEDNISEILKRLLTGDKIDMSEELQPVSSLREIKNAIHTFFESFKVTDLFAEVFEIERNRSILDKQEFYLYFCDIAFKGAKYPIFYIPFAIQPENDVLKSATIRHDGRREILQNTNVPEVEFIISELRKLKQLESYGYKFLRINRFNISDNPMETLADFRDTSPITGYDRSYGRSKFPYCHGTRSYR